MKLSGTIKTISTTYLLNLRQAGYYYNMAIKSLYKDYFQKSRVFLYPILEIKRGASVTPIETYVSWKDHYSKDDMKLICLYHLRNDQEFLLFEKERLYKNKYFFDFKQVEDNKGVYIFDFSPLGSDWKKIINGKYSELTVGYKKKIEAFYGKRDNNYAYIESFLYPEKYYSMYAEMIQVKESVLREVKELCSKLDLDKETLIASIKDLHIKSKSTNL